jgi:predicted transposase/invertase (TIGR01784 family)
MELHTIELSKFEDQIEGEQLNEADELKLLLSKVKTSLDRWVAFLTRHNLLDKHNLPEELNDPQLEKALEIIEVMNLSDEERDAYEAHLHWLRIEESTLNKAKKDAREEGRGERDIEIVMNMLSLGIDIKIIAKSTGLTIKQIREIKKQMDKEK